MNHPPRNPNPDLQAPLIDSGSFDDPEPINNGGPERRPSYVVRENLLRDMQMRIYGSIVFCLSSITLSVFKIIISSALLVYDKSQCNQDLDRYFKFMISHDVVNCMVLTTRLATIISIYGGRNLDREDVEGQYHNVVNPHGGQVATIPRPLLSVDNLTHERLARYSWRLRINAIVFGLNNFWYCLLFIYAHYLYFQTDSNCADLASYKNGVMLSYIILGYIFVGLPTLSFFVICFCLPCLLLAMHFAKKRKQEAANRWINKLPVKKYTPDLPGNPECSICMVEYQNQDNIIQLECSPLHYFHEDCAKKWLKINQHCPICRKSIMPEGRELQPIPQNNPAEDINDLEAQRLERDVQRRYS